MSIVFKRNKNNDSENEATLQKSRFSRNTDSASPLKRSNCNERSLSEESPKKRIRVPNFDSNPHIKRLQNAKASLSLCTESEQRKYASTPKSERRAIASASRIKSLSQSEDMRRNLSNNWADIIDENEQQSKELNEYVEKVAAKYKLDKEVLKQQIETNPEVLRKRQKNINFGKVTEEYKKYIEKVSKKKRESFHPRTPNKFRKCSRRKFDGLIKKWRKLLHVWDENPENLKDFKYSIENGEDPEDEKDDFGGCSGISYDIDDYELIDSNDDVDFCDDAHEASV